MSDPDGEAETLNHIGQVRLDATSPTAAQERFDAALTIARRIGTPAHEGRALEGIGHCLLRQGRHDDGVGFLREALDVYRRISSPHTARVESALESSAGVY